jgi:hypothetical protein
MAEDGFMINGVMYGPDDLTFREQREMRKVIRELAEDPQADLENMSLTDVVPAFVFMVLKRDNPDLELDEVLDMKLTDFVAHDEPEPKKRPTRAAKAAASGSQK